MLLESIYEQDFHDGSYGFRPRRSPHDAMDALRKETMRIGGGWILEVDLRKFFDTLDHSHLRDLVSRRIRDGVVRRLIGKWLKAGLGIELLRPGEKQWIRPGSCPDRVAFCAVTSGADSGAEAFVIVFEPTSGVWRFRPFLADFPDLGSPYLENSQTSVSLKVYGRHLTIAEQAAPAPMTRPGDYGLLFGFRFRTFRWVVEASWAVVGEVIWIASRAGV